MPNHLRCFKYQWLEYPQTSCRGQLTYSRCASVGNAASDCNLEHKCVNLSQPHLSYFKLCPKWKIGSRVGRNQTTAILICDRWMQEGTTDRRGLSHPSQCTTSREDRRIVCMVVTDRSVTSRTVAQHIESVTHHSVSARTIQRTPFTAEWSVCKTSIAWSTLDAEPQAFSPQMMR
ncbi:uncharacterized protein TNCV_2248791 [Trichonephila clavipes]|nr:uncharacterized protein TNCV_2248791 [Trichonephila clavipes]